MYALIRMGLLAGFRSHAIKVLLIATVALVSLALLASGFSGRQPLTVGLDVGLSTMRLVLLIISLTWVQLLLAQEVERKTLYFVLAYPYSRSQFLISRYATLAILSGVATAFTGLALWLSLKLGGGNYTTESTPTLDGRFLIVIFGIWLDLLVILAFTVLLCTLSTTPFLPLLLGLAFALAARGLGPTFDYLREQNLADPDHVKWLGPILEHAYMWLPDLSRLDWRALALYNLPVDGTTIWLGSLMALAFIAIMLAIAVMIFNRRDFI